MSDKYPFIPEYLTKALEDVTIPLIDIMHGELKNLMHDAEQQLDPLDKTEAELQYWNGRLDALTDMYAMTYNLSIDRKRIEEK